MNASIISVALLLLLCSLSLTVTGKDTSTTTPQPPRKSRNYDNFFHPENFIDESSEEGGDSKPLYTDAGTPPKPDSARWDDFAKYANKGYDKPDQKSPQFYKGYPYYAPTWKGGLDAPPTTDQEMVEMMVAMNAMNKLQGLSSPKREEKGLLATLLADPKYILVAALVPVSIMLASFIPILANYFTAGGSSLPSVVTTLASSRLARAFDDEELMAKIMENILEFGAKVMEEGECFQKVVCETALEQGGAENVQAAAGVLGTFSKQSWLSSMGVENIVKALEKGNCKNLCSQSNKGIDLRF